MPGGPEFESRPAPFQQWALGPPSAMGVSGTHASLACETIAGWTGQSTGLGVGGLSCLDGCLAWRVPLPFLHLTILHLGQDGVSPQGREPFPRGLSEISHQTPSLPTTGVSTSPRDAPVSSAFLGGQEAQSIETGIFQKPKAMEWLGWDRSPANGQVRDLFMGCVVLKSRPVV